MATNDSMAEVQAKTTVGQLRVATFCAEPVSAVVQETQKGHHIFTPRGAPQGNTQAL